MRKGYFGSIRTQLWTQIIRVLQYKIFDNIRKSLSVYICENLYPV